MFPTIELIAFPNTHRYNILKNKCIIPACKSRHPNKLFKVKSVSSMEFIVEPPTSPKMVKKKKIEVIAIIARLITGHFVIATSILNGIKNQ